MEKILPIGTNEWNKVLDEHSNEYSGRSVLLIRRSRYQNLHRKNAPTGSPNMPDDVRQAKRIKYKIGKKAELSDGTEEFHLEQGFQSSIENNVDITGTDGRHSTQTTQPRLQSTIQQSITTTSTTIRTTNDTPPAPALPALAVEHGSTITPLKRSYTSRVQTQSPSPGGDRFLQTYQISLQHDKLQQERKAHRWERERIERQEGREDMIKMIGFPIS